MSNSIPSSPRAQSIPELGYIAAVPTEDGSVLGICAERGQLHLRWVNDINDEPIYLSVGDLDRLQQLVRDARAVLNVED